MNTPTHMIIGGALWAKRDRPGSLFAAFAGGLAPDLPMIAMILFATKVTGVPEQDVYGILYFSDEWQRVFAIDHSFLVWGLVLAAGYLLRVFTLTAFAGSGLAHAAVDFLTHHDDARQQLWPFTDWKFASPFSYWDPAYFGSIVAPLEALLVFVLTISLVFRLRRLWEKALTLAISAIFLVPIVVTGGFHGLHGM